MLTATMLTNMNQGDKHRRPLLAGSTGHGPYVITVAHSGWCLIVLRGTEKRRWEYMLKSWDFISSSVHLDWAMRYSHPIVSPSAPWRGYAVGIMYFIVDLTSSLPLVRKLRLLFSSERRNMWASMFWKNHGQFMTLLWIMNHERLSESPKNAQRFI
jgi:hypothetical protein